MRRNEILMNASVSSKLIKFLFFVSARKQQQTSVQHFASGSSGHDRKENFLRNRAVRLLFIGEGFERGRTIESRMRYELKQTQVKCNISFIVTYLQAKVN